jgi:hypothetical protein
MFDYSPKLPELIFYPILGGLFALGVAENFPSPNSNLFFGAVCVNCAFVSSFYLYREACRYIDSATPSQFAGKFTAPTDDQPTSPDYNNIPQVKSGGEPLYNQQMVRLKIDCVGKFNRTLIDQHTGKLEVNLTEDFWLKLHGADQSRWVTAGGVGRNDFVDMLERGVLWGAYKKVGGQGKRVPDKWRKIAQLADGYPLPSWEQLGVKSRNP